MQYGLQDLLGLDASLGGVRWMKIMRLELRNRLNLVAGA